MTDVTLTTFDAVPYLSVPLLNARSLISLSLALEALMPADRSDPVEHAAKQQAREREALEQVLDSRTRAVPEQILAGETELDIAVDGAWVYTRDGLRQRQIYARPGFKTLAAAQGEGAVIDYAAQVDAAERAAALYKRLFGAEGLSFLRTRYPEQGAATASLLRIIEEDGLAQELDALVGPGTVAMLKDLQVRYEAMVEARAARERGGGDGLKQQSARLRQAISLYALSLCGTVDAKHPETVAQVADALRPILNSRAEQRRPGSGGAVEDMDDAGEGEDAELPDDEDTPEAEGDAPGDANEAEDAALEAASA